MKQFWREVGLAVVLGMLMPGLILNIVTYSSRRYVSESNPTAPTVHTQTEALIIPVLTNDGWVEDMELEEYLTGVVLAEMPASFEEEALKAQAVVARTYTLRAHNGKGKHDGASVCTDSACCQAYRSEENYFTEGGSMESVDKVREAVEDTYGLVLTYQGELIEATYFSCSGGSTEDALAVWGTDVPYLKAVSSPGEEDATYYTDSVSFSQSEIEDKLQLELQEDSAAWFGDVSYTSGGGVDTMVIGGKTFEGTELRQLLGLRSTAFSVTVEGATVTFHTRGFGHRVGMSQYGADAMAVSGCSFEEILQHYYQGTALERYSD